MIYKRIRNLREDNDYTQSYIGKILNIHQRTYAYYESGERMIPPNILCLLEDFYNTSVDYLLERTDKKQPYPLKQHELHTFLIFSHKIS